MKLRTIFLHPLSFLEIVDDCDSDTAWHMSPATRGSSILFGEADEGEVLNLLLGSGNALAFLAISPISAIQRLRIKVIDRCVAVFD